MDLTIPSFWHYVWFFWSTAFLVPWLILFLNFPQHCKVMWWASVFTAPFGLTEPLFVPDYWNPPALFELAQTTGFDIESLIFSFDVVMKDEAESLKVKPRKYVTQFIRERIADRIGMAFAFAFHHLHRPRRGGRKV